MKRKATSPESSTREKEAGVQPAKTPGYCSQGDSKKDDAGNLIWPAPEEQMRAARAFLQEWQVQVSSIVFL